jgi:hypothetical protein
MQINLSEETEELVYIVAALGRVSNPLNVELYEKLYDTLSIGEKHRSEEMAKRMEFS